MRRITTERWALAREQATVQTPRGQVGIKLAWPGERVVDAAPEYEDCRQLTLERGVPRREIYAAARDKNEDQVFQYPAALGYSQGRSIQQGVYCP